MNNDEKQTENAVEITTENTLMTLNNNECKDIGIKKPRKIALNNEYSVLVDEEDYNWLVSLGKWKHVKVNKGKKIYARLRVKNAEYYMHKLIMERHSGKNKKCVSHLDNNGLNNQKTNLVYGFIATWAEDLVGKRFGRWTVESFHHIEGRYKRFWNCKCDCGNKGIIVGDSLRHNQSKSCGCLAKEVSSLNGKLHKTHGMSYTGVYESWQDMIYRCTNPTRKCFVNYGLRGIKICKRWLNSFNDFYLDMGNRPENLTLDRIDNNKNYSCGKCEECIKNGWKMNCRWATQKTQTRNTRKNVKIEYNGETKCVAEWAEEYNIPYRLLYQRLFRRFWSMEEALNTPLLGHGYTINGNSCNATFIEFGGKTQSIRAWAKEVGLKHQTLWARIKADWDIEYALTEPPLRGGEWDV